MCLSMMISYASTMRNPRHNKWQTVIILLLWVQYALSLSPRFFPKAISNERQDQKTLGPAITEIDHPRRSNSSFPGDQTGDSPFFYCPESDPENDLFAIDTMVLNPNPPHINYVYVVHAHGYWRESIYEENFRLVATVKREDRPGLDFSLDFDFCDFIDLVEMDGRSVGCPPDKGGSTIHKFEFVDFGISEGNYSVKVDAKANGRRVFCVQAWFEMPRNLIKHPS